MNIIFHTAASIGLSVLLTDTRNIENSNKKTVNIVKTGAFAFLSGIFLHGILDYIPHCYPLSAKYDILISLMIISTVILLAKKDYKLIFIFAFIGNIFPDLIDLLPSILNKYLKLNVIVYKKIFPWHFLEYSGSLYNVSCKVSAVNHLIVLFFLLIILCFRVIDVKNIFLKKE